MVALGHDRATVVGHSLGGGIAMQFAYQFPERCERLVLVSSGGLGREVHPLLRASTLPGAEWVMPWLMHERVLGAGEAVGRLIGLLRLQAGTDTAEVARGFASLGDAEARAAFIETMRAVLDPGGQRVSALDRLYLTEALPSLLVWGENDPIIPVEHGRAAHEAMPGSRLELLPGVGHFPQLERPYEFAALLSEFIAETVPAELDTETMRERLAGRGRAHGHRGRLSARLSPCASGSARSRGQAGPRRPRSSPAGTSPAARRRRAGAAARPRRGPRAGRSRGCRAPRTAARSGG